MLNLGCGIKAHKDFINVDKYHTEKDLREHKGVYRDAVFEKGAKYVQADIVSMPFPDDYADWVEMHEVIEHLPYRQVIPALREVCRVMKKGATLILHCPNFTALAIDYLQLVTRMGSEFDLDPYIRVMQTIVGNQAGEGEYHKTAFNSNFLMFCLLQAGFAEVSLVNYPKGYPIIAMGKLNKANPKSVFRNDILFATVKK